MIDEQLEEQASLYVLGALEGEELRAFEARVAVDTELRARVDELSEAAARVAHGAPARALPPHLEARVMAEIRAQSPQLPATPSRSNWIPWAVAASLAVACIIVLGQQQRTAKELADAREETAASQKQISTLTEERNRVEQQLVQVQEREAASRAQMATLAAARDEAARKLAQAERRDALSGVQVATLTSKLENAPDATAAVIWDEERQRGVLNTSTMPANSDDRDYQLWIVDPKYSQPVDAGVFTVERTGATRYAFKPKSRINSATAFAISLERKGGVPKAEGPIVLAGK